MGCQEALAKANQTVGMRDGVLTMAVLRLGGFVEGRPTERVNFLQRIDALIAMEAKLASLSSYLSHQGECSKWGPVWEYPRHIHSEIACTCGLDALIGVLGVSA